MRTAKEYIIQLTLKSDTTFSRGDGVAGLLDREVEHDQYGLPYLHGRTLKGLLGEEADNLLKPLRLLIPSAIYRHGLKHATVSSVRTAAAKQLPPSCISAMPNFPKDVRNTVRLQADDNFLTPDDVLSSLTAVRRQTAVNGDGVPHDGSLRSMRVICAKLSSMPGCTALEDLTDKKRPFGSVRAGAAASRHRT
ncbi:MAG: RAMP superfamily protein [Chloroflexota bacterium]